MTTYVAAELRRLVMARARLRCEYCLIHESDTFLGCQIEHIISEKHQGPTVLENLALACTYCNRAKGTDIGSLTAAGIFTRFFHPRNDAWLEHFALDGPFIHALSEIGEVTSTILQFNHPDRIEEREVLLEIGRYPRE